MSKTPPPSSPPLLSTPVCSTTVTTGKYCIKFEKRHNVFCWLSVEMMPFFIGPMPLQMFLDTFLPLPKGTPPKCELPECKLQCLPSFKEGMFTSMMGLSQKNGMYDIFVRFRSHLSCHGSKRLWLEASFPKVLSRVSYDHVTIPGQCSRDAFKSR